MIHKFFKDCFKKSLLITYLLHGILQGKETGPIGYEYTPEYIYSLESNQQSPLDVVIRNGSQPILDNPTEDFQAIDWKASEQDPDFLFNPNMLQNYHIPSGTEIPSSLSNAKSKLQAIIDENEQNSVGLNPAISIKQFDFEEIAQAEPPSSLVNPTPAPTSPLIQFPEPTQITPVPVQQTFEQTAPTQAPIQILNNEPSQGTLNNQETTKVPSGLQNGLQNEIPAEETSQVGSQTAPGETPPKTILINFNNVNIIEFIRFISRISNRNFVFDENDLQFTVTIVSEEPTTIDNIMTALLQELRIHDLSLLEQGNNLIIHRNPKAGVISTVVTDETPTNTINAEMITKVFRLNTVEADKAAGILKPMMSEKALVEVLPETNHLIVTDLTANINEISRLLKSIDSPQSGLVIGQYVVRNAFMDTLIALGERIMQPISRDQTLIFVPHLAANSIFIVSTPYLVERTMSVLQYIDQNQGTTRILNPKDLRFQDGHENGQWELDSNGNWQFKPKLPAGINIDQEPQGRWVVDPQGNWYFQPGAPSGTNNPEGDWIRNAQGAWAFQLKQGSSISPQRLSRPSNYAAELPVGHIERTKFYIHKLRYRNGDQIARALSKIAESLLWTGTSNEDLVAAINSIQWLEGSNSLVVTGTPESIEKVKELIEEIDTPMRQVFLEMLILETAITDDIALAVNPGARFGGGLTAGSVEFLSSASTLNQLLTSAATTVPTPPPNPTVINQIPGFTLGVVGMHLSHGGTLYATLGAFVSALHSRTTVNIVTNPKILTEDNSPAEVFVGENTQFPTQSISNDLGSIVTQNFEFRDVGTRLKVTPLIGNNDIITLDIQEEVSRIVSGGTTVSNLSNQVIGPTTSVSRTTTKVHVPNKYFLVLSGNMADTLTRRRSQVPCIGGIPVIGALFSDKEVKDEKANLMIFIRPEIIDTEEEIRNLTSRQQDIFRYKKRRPSNWKFEVEESLDFLNLEDTEDSEGRKECY